MEQEPEVEKSSLVFTGRGSPARSTGPPSGPVGVAALVAVGGGVLVGGGGIVGNSVGMAVSGTACPHAANKTANTNQRKRLSITFAPVAHILHRLNCEVTILIEELAIDDDLTAIPHVRNQVPVNRRLILAARFWVPGAQGHVN